MAEYLMTYYTFALTATALAKRFLPATTATTHLPHSSRNVIAPAMGR